MGKTFVRANQFAYFSRARLPTVKDMKCESNEKAVMRLNSLVSLFSIKYYRKEVNICEYERFCAFLLKDKKRHKIYKTHPIKAKI